MCSATTPVRISPELAKPRGMTFAENLLIWFDQFGRKNLPWQQDITPYRVWVSEIMLQQTQVATVIPYFARFLEVFPSVDMLAAASEDEVLHQWTGLGYYARARNLHKTARQLMSDFNGEFPLNVQQLVTLPGIGRSTAGAIVAICSNQYAVILDGNVKRVLARYFAIPGWPGETKVVNQLWEKATALTPAIQVADYTQAIMDLGATLCSGSHPDCDACPFITECAAHRAGEVENYPGKKPKKVLPIKKTCMLVIENEHREILLEKRPSSGLWGGLWSFPETKVIDDFMGSLNVKTFDTRKLPAFRHSFTHFHLQIAPIHIRIREVLQVTENDRLCWYSSEAPLEIGLSRPVTRILAAI